MSDWAIVIVAGLICFTAMVVAAIYFDVGKGSKK